MTAGTSPTMCLLLVGDRVVLRASGPPDAEYAMFDLGDIELRASEPGRVREHGYQTTVEQARTRLAHLGMTADVAREVAQAMLPVLSDAYARGTAARRVARHLGALELLQSEYFDAAQHAYRGVFLDLAALSRDLGVEHASATLHALSLALTLETEPDDTAVLLSTDACTKGGKPGARTYRRPAFAERPRLLQAALALASRAPKPEIADALPRADVIAFLRVRADAATDEGSRALYRSLQSRVALRDMPEKGPLALPELWAIESKIESGELDGCLDAIEEAERQHGRTPGTTYLRARVSLLTRTEPPTHIAERVSSLALSMTSFQELALLASEAWLEAGEPRRAMPFARDLADAPGLDEGLLLRAQRLLARAVGAAPQKNQPALELQVTAPRGTRPPAPVASNAITLDEEFPPFAQPPTGLDHSVLDDLVPALPTPAPAAPPGFDASVAPSFPHASRPPTFPPTSAGPSRGLAPAAARPSARPPLVLEPPPLEVAGAWSRPPPAPAWSSPPAAAPDADPPAAPDDRDSVRVPASLEFAGQISLGEFSFDDAPLGTRSGAGESRADAADTFAHVDLSPPQTGASFTLDLPGPAPARAAPLISEPPPVPSSKPSRRARLSGVLMETRPPASFDPRAEPDSPIVPRTEASLEGNPVRHWVPAPEARPAPARRASSSTTALADKTAHERPTPMRPPSSDAQPRPRASSFAPPKSSPAPPEAAFLEGASHPPFQHESTTPLLPRAPLLPRLDGPADELAEHLALPPGVGEARVRDVVPTSVLEARVQFTLLSRELGRDFRKNRGIELRADVSGIEAIQAVLLESFPDHVVRTKEEARELRRYGAFLSEILARQLDAEWLDISRRELGHWVMFVPANTRVWPFGRIARLVTMGHKERDLVSYFFEISSRARGR